MSQACWGTQTDALGCLPSVVQVAVPEAHAFAVNLERSKGVACQGPRGSSAPMHKVAIDARPKAMQKPWKQQTAPEGPRRAAPAAAGCSAGCALALLAAFLLGAWAHAHMGAVASLLARGRMQAPSTPSDAWLAGDAGASSSAATLVAGGAGWLHPGRQQLQAQHLLQPLAQQPRKKVRAFIGVFSSFSVPHDAKDDDKVRAAVHCHLGCLQP